MSGRRAWLAAAALVLAGLLLTLRACTGLVTIEDDALERLVWKDRPSLSIESRVPSAALGRHERVLDDDEQRLAYHDAYVGLMGEAPWLAAGLLAAAAALLARKRPWRRAGR